MTTATGFVTVDEARLYYEAAGAGQPVVFIHAGVADSRQWNNEFVAFQPDYRVVRYDMRGYGRSEPVAGAFSHMKDLGAVLDQLRVSPPVLVGCSMGGSMAIDYALAHPGQVRALVTVGSGPSGLSLDVPGHPLFPAAEEAWTAGDLERLAELETQIWFDGMGRTAADVNPEMRALALEMDRLALAHEALNLGERERDAAEPAAEQLGALQLPVLLLVGAHDVPFALAAADVVVEQAPNARKLVLPNAAHLANMDDPAAFEAALRGFLADAGV